LFGIILVQKDAGRTSHDVVDGIRRKFGTRRVGHAGTLDPLATGLLVVAVGPATRFLQYLPLEPKEYIAQITFGRATSTYDLEGETTQESPVPSDLPAAIGEVLPKFTGLISQLPPMYSAVKIDGKPLYHYARQGKEIEREPRNVHIEAFEIKLLSEDTVEARIVCSGGTYIRSLAHDLGQAMGCGAHLSKLERTRVGRFSLDEGKPLSEALPSDLVPLKEALQPMPMVPMDETQVLHIREGRQVGLMEMPSASLVALLDTHGEVFSVARVQGSLLQPECVIPSEAFNAVS
jgi:tRNA pseudouridine55 synthase